LTTLKGMTWRHPRGFDPMVATSEEWRRKTGVEIIWEQRSLQDFESYPVEDLARKYDLIVVDHPHAGQIADENCLLPLGRPDRTDELAALAANSVGQSFPSYFWRGHQWALPIDAATQVQAYRADALKGPVSRWDEVLQMAREGRVLIPMRSPHNLMCFYTLAANLGAPCASSAGDRLVEPGVGERVIHELAELMAHVRPECWDMDPIAALDALASGAGPEVLIPFTYGYVSYAMDDFRAHRIAFANIPVLGKNGPVGSALGGTGIAVSAFSEHAREAIAYAFWVAGAEVQTSTFARAGGQPGHAAAWKDDGVNRPVHDFYRDTWPTLEGAWVRPRHNGYMGFQTEGSRILEVGLRNQHAAADIIAALNAAYAHCSLSA
jgi:multiple sugar transport system substrate-binding protein